MTKKEYYDLLVRSASDGTFPAINGVTCMYRKNETANCPQRCAIGLLIPDEKYCPEIEGLQVDSIIEKGLVTIPDGITCEDLSIVQACHDKYAKRIIWPANEFIQEIDDLECFQDL